MQSFITIVVSEFRCVKHQNEPTNASDDDDEDNSDDDDDDGSMHAYSICLRKCVGACLRVCTYDEWCVQSEREEKNGRG